MNIRWATKGAVLLATAIHADGFAQNDHQGVRPAAAEQQEADYRVIAARCGTPAFERAFDRQSKHMVAAGLIAPGRAPKAVEASITSLRRSPFVLIAASSDCPAQLAQLADLQRRRGSIGVTKKAVR